MSKLGTILAQVALTQVTDRRNRQPLGSFQFAKRFDADVVSRSDTELAVSETLVVPQVKDFFWVQVDGTVEIDIQQPNGQPQTCTCNGFVVWYGSTGELTIRNNGTATRRVTLIWA